MLEKILNPYLFVLLNLAIILAAEFTGGGAYFEDTGLIHIIAIIFVVFCVYLISNFWYLRRGVFFNIFQGFLIALTFFSLVHIIEYMAITKALGERMAELADFNAMILYGLGFTIIFNEFKKILNLYHGHHSKTGPAWLIVAVLALTSFFTLMRGNADFLGSDILLPFLMLIFNAGIGAFLFFRSSDIEEIMPMFRELMSYMRFSFIFIIIAVLFEFLEGLEMSWVSATQITYSAHFSFYIALSIQLLAMGKLFKLGGIYKDLREEIIKITT